VGELQVEHPERTRPATRDRQRWLRNTSRGQDDITEIRLAAHHTLLFPSYPARSHSPPDLCELPRKRLAPRPFPFLPEPLSPHLAVDPHPLRRSCRLGSAQQPYPEPWCRHDNA